MQISDQNTTLWFLTFIKPGQIQTTLKKIKHFHWSLVQYYSTICTVATKSPKHKNTLERKSPFCHPTLYWTRKRSECYLIQENSRLPFRLVSHKAMLQGRLLESNHAASLLCSYKCYVQLLHESKWMEVDQTLHWAIYGNQSKPRKVHFPKIRS